MRKTALLGAGVARMTTHPTARRGSVWSWGRGSHSCHGDAVSDHADPQARLETIQGVPAYVAPPSTDDAGENHPGYAAFMQDAVEVSVEGYRSAEQLVSIAEATRLNP